MSKPGPRPLPRNLRIVKGVEEKPSLHNLDEPEVPVSIPAAPEHLTADEQNAFDDVARKLARMRVMTDVDINALVIYARAWVEAKDAHRRVVEMGLMVKAPKSGTPMHNPYRKVRDDAEAKCLKILCEFGLTPSSRTRVKAQ